MKSLYFIAKHDLEMQVKISKEHWKFKFPHFDTVKAFENIDSEEGEDENQEETKQKDEVKNDEASYTVQVELHEL